MELVSIIMPVKNAATFLKPCLHSILDQTYPNWELIAIDDHSEDQSIAICNAFNDPRIRTFRNNGQGIIPALQQAFEMSFGQYITRMDADDLMTPKRIEMMVEVLNQNHSGTIVTGMVKYFSDQPVSDGYQKYEMWLNEINLSEKQWENIYRECVIASPNWMASREDLTNIGGFSPLTYPEDYHLVLKWYQHQLTIQTIPETTLLWREHPKRTSRNSINYSQEAFFKLKINTFIQTDLHTHDLVLWGSNEKTKLTAQILNHANIPFHHFSLSDFQQTEKLNDPQVLVGVYPEEKERAEIEAYLDRISLQKGKDWWYV